MTLRGNGWAALSRTKDLKQAIRVNPFKSTTIGFSGDRPWTNQ
jgi:hypothetical protein